MYQVGIKFFFRCKQYCWLNMRALKQSVKELL
jgi:hypothetical protein